MAWPKGQPRIEKTGGRQRGTPNRRSEELQHRIEELLNGQDLPGAIFSKIKKLPAERQVQILMDLMPYVYPRRKAAEIKVEGGMCFADFMAASEMGTKANGEPLP